MQYLAAILGVLFLIAFIIERWATRNWKRRERIERGRADQWWKDPPGDGPEGDY